MDASFNSLAVANHDSNDVSILLNDTIWAPHIPDSFHQQPSARPSKQPIQVALPNSPGIFPTNLVFTAEQLDLQRISPEIGIVQPVRPRLQGIEIAQPVQGDGTANRPPRRMARHASDAVFETWDSPIGDELAVYLMQPSWPRSARLLLQ